MLTQRLYYRDSQVYEFEATVVGALIADARSLVRLDRTAFYPTSGGQPHDIGEINGIRVVDVIDSPSGIQHVLDGVALEVGQTVFGRIERARRVDHTQQHSGQHILSQAFEQIAKAHTVSFHLGVEVSTIDVNRPDMDLSMATEAENVANQVVFDDRPVTIHFASGDGLLRFDLRKPSERAGEVRIVDVEGYDQSACGGTHVLRTGQIGPIKIRRLERRGSSTRVEFLCGWRALRDYSSRLLATRDLATRLSAADHDVRDLVFRSLDDLAQAKDEINRLRDILLDSEADGLIASASNLPLHIDARVIRRSWSDRSPDELQRLAMRIAARATSVVLLGSLGERNYLVFAQSPDLTYDMSAIIRQVAPTIGARGGGSRNLAQCGGPGGQPVEVAIDLAFHLLHGGSVAPDVGRCHNEG